MKTQLSVLAALGLMQGQALITRGGEKYTHPNRSEAQYVEQIKQRMSTKETPEAPEELWFNATIDHFDNHGAGSPTYPMRYLVDRSHFDSEKGPIIFYAGNEGDVWTFWENSGFMHTTLAEEFGALVVFGEHRYYGESKPYGDATFERQHLNMLTVEQAMLDYVDLIKMIKTTEGLEDRAVIVGGGSYGGMLSAWLRMKYPQWF